jgi:hypothetical protein
MAINLTHTTTESITADSGNLLLSANVGVGVTPGSYKLQVGGSFAATTKSFVIDHPSKEGYQLVHGSLEGPENGVYVRGKLYDQNTIILPDYWKALIDEETITVSITPVGKYQRIYVSEITNEYIKLFSNDGSIDCHYVIFAERKDVDKLKVEISL